MGDAQPGTWAVFYKVPLEDPVQTLQPDLGLAFNYTKKPCMELYQLQKYLLCFSKKKKKAKSPLQPTVLPIQTGC